MAKRIKSVCFGPSRVLVYKIWVGLIRLVVKNGFIFLIRLVSQIGQHL